MALLTLFRGKKGLILHFYEGKKEAVSAESGSRTSFGAVGVGVRLVCVSAGRLVEAQPRSCFPRFDRSEVATQNAQPERVCSHQRKKRPRQTGRLID